MYEQHKKNQHAGKCDDQQIFKDILEDALLSTTEEVTDSSPNLYMTSSPVKKPSARKSLCVFTNILDVKPKTAKYRFMDAKFKRKSMKVGNGFWTKEKNQKGIQKSMSRSDVTCIHG